MTTKLGETEAQRQKEKKEVERTRRREESHKVSGSSARNKLTKDKNLVVVSILVSWYSTINVRR